MVEIVSFSCETIIVKGTSSALKYNRIGIIVLIKLYFYFLETVVKDI